MRENEEIIMEDGIMTQDESGLNLDNFSQGNYVNNPTGVNQTIVFEILKIGENKNIKGKSKETGKEFDIGLTYKDGTVRRYDVETDLGVYTIKNWEIFFKLLGKTGLLVDYAKKHNKKFTGAKISITRLLDGGHANYKVEDLAKVIGKSIEDTKAYQESIKKAIKEQRLFDVKLLN